MPPSCNIAWPFVTFSLMIFFRKISCLVSLFLLFICTCSPGSVVLADINGDALALLAFKGNLTHAASAILLSWNASNISGICTTWEGVRCSASSNGSLSTQRVVALHLPGSSLLGPIAPQTIGSLDALQILSLRKNKLSGTLPTDLANCASLEQLILNNNSLSGSLPVNFSTWPLLKKLDLSSNNFSGEIPSSLNTLTRLNALFLEDNKFSGAIPSLSVPPLRNFSVADNRLNGSIPVSLSKFPVASFTGNLDLCGAPLPKCPTSTVGSPAPTPSTTASDASSGRSNSKNLSTGAIVGIVVAALAAVIVVLSICFLLVVRRNHKQGPDEELYAEGRAEFRDRTRAGALSKKGSGHSGVKVEPAPTRNENDLTFMGNAKHTFHLEDLLRASAEVLGKGSLGTTYKAVVDDRQVICVKRFREVVTGREETCNHIEMLGALRHPNLVPLRAYFFAPKGKLLVSDYMSKGSMSSLLHGSKRAVKEPLDWASRLSLASSAAKGVVFLHSKKVVHGSIKSSNVVLDSDGSGRLTDYGLAQLIARPVGSSLNYNAYTPPEAREESRKITYKGDVYAFGVLLLELVTGKSPNNEKSISSVDKGGLASSGADYLVDWVQSHDPQDLEKVLDPLLHAKSDGRAEDDMIALLHIALACISLSPEKRPHMVEVVSSIQSLQKHDEYQPGSTDFYFTQAV